MKNTDLDIMNGEEVLRKSLSSAPDGRPLARRIFFEENSWQLDDEFLPLLRAHAEYLRQNPQRVAVVAGYSASAKRQRRCWLIGERRSRAVVRALLDAGVRPSQLAGVSKGETQPQLGRSERSERYLRRVNIQYVAPAEVSAKVALPPGAPAWWQTTLSAGRPVLLQAAH